jgi:acetyl esterase/lipase
MNHARLVLIFVATIVAVSGQQLAVPQREIALYPGAAPGSENWNWSERQTTTSSGMPMVQNVVHPVLQYYPAEKTNAAGTAMIIAPGGGFRNLMMSYEGVDIAGRLNALGIDAFILKYRLTYTPGGPGGSVGEHPQQGQNVRELAGADGQQAVRIVRQHAAEYGVRPDRIGMIGYSAGGAVLLSAVTGPVDSRPNFAAPIYAAGAETAKPPTDSAPPLFIAVASDDQAVGWQGSIDLYTAWRKANIPVELHVFQTGQHGFTKKGGGADHYLDRLQEWLRINGWLTKATI